MILVVNDKPTFLRLAGEKYLDYEQIGPRCVREFSWDVVAAREFEILTEAADNL